MKEVIVAICDDNPQAIIDLREKLVGKRGRDKKISS